MDGQTAGTGTLNYEECRREWWVYVRHSCFLWCRRYRLKFELPQIIFEECLQDGWSRAWEYWPSVQKARNPRALCAQLVKQAFMAARNWHVGRWTMHRGKKTYFHSGRVWRAFTDIVSPDAKHGQESDLAGARSLRGHQASVLEEVIVRELGSTLDPDGVFGHLWAA